MERVCLVNASDRTELLATVPTLIISPAFKDGTAWTYCGFSSISPQTNVGAVGHAGSAVVLPCVEAFTNTLSAVAVVPSRSSASTFRCLRFQRWR